MTLRRALTTQDIPFKEADMRNKDEIKLDALSMMDDEIVDKQSEKRYKLMTRKRAPRWVISSSVAAVILVAIMVPILILLFAKQVPIYEGMSVLDNYNGSSAAAQPHEQPYRFDFLSNTNGNNGNHNGHNKKPIDEIIEEDTSIGIEFPEQQMYYAEPGQDIYINVHISNPDNFVILSFTLNGKMYSSYMFEEGSDMENLILKVSVDPAAEGIIEYTIDAIKYVDGTEIKDVIMKGDRTVKVGVYSEQNLPSVSVTNKATELTKLTFEIEPIDEHAMISGSEGQVYAVLTDNDSVVAYKELSVGSVNTVEFGNLSDGLEYRLAVVAYYDSFDGNGFSAHVLYEQEVSTKALVYITDLKLDRGSLSFDLEVDDRFPIVIEGIDLVSGGIVVQSIGAEQRKFENVAFIGEYFVSARYTNGENKGSAMSYDSITIDIISDVSYIVPGGTIYKPFTSDMMIWNAGTLDFRVHPGIDIKVTGDASVYAAAPGTVTNVYYDDHYSWGVVITLEDGITEMHYHGLNEYSIQVAIDDKVVGGTLLGSAEAPLYEVADPDHLHFSVYENGVAIDPQKYVTYPILDITEYEFMQE